MLDNLIGYATRLPEMAIAGVIIVFWLIALWVSVDKLTKFDQAELIDRDNRAFAVSRASLIAAHAIAMTYALADYGPVLDDAGNPASGVHIQWDWLGYTFLEGLYIYLVLLLTRPIIDFLVLPKDNNVELLRKGNLAVGFTEAGAYLGVGIMLGASLTGQVVGGGIWLNIVASFVFYLLGIGLQFAGFWIHEAITRYNVRDHLLQGRASSGIDTGALLLAISLSVSPAAAGDLTRWGEGLAVFVATGVTALVLMYPIWALLRFVGPTRGFSDSDGASLNVASALVNATMIVIIGYCVNQLITWMLYAS